MELVRVKVNSCQLLIGDLYFGWIDIGVEICLNSQPCFGCSRRNEIDNHLVTDQRTPTPIHGNEREQAMFDLVPLAGPRWIMTYGHIQSRLIGPVLQLGATAAATDCRNLQRFSTTRLVVGIEKRRVFEGSVGGAVAPIDTVGVVGTLPLGFGTKRLGSRIKDEPALLHRLLHIHV